MLDDRKLEEEILALLMPIHRIFVVDNLEITTSKNRFIKTIQWTARSSHFDLKGGGCRDNITERELALVIAREIEKKLDYLDSKNNL